MKDNKQEYIEDKKGKKVKKPYPIETLDIIYPGNNQDIVLKDGTKL